MIASDIVTYVLQLDRGGAADNAARQLAFFNGTRGSRFAMPALRRTFISNMWLAIAIMKNDYTFTMIR